MAKWVYMFKEGNADMRNLLGGKGANLAEMTNLGLPIPQGFTVTTEACTDYYTQGKQISDEIKEQIFDCTCRSWKRSTGKKFGDTGGSAACIRSFRRKSFHAWYDGHHPEPRTERCCSRRLRKEDRQSEIRIRFLQKIYPDVLRRCYGDQQSQNLSAILDEIKEAKGAKYDTDLTCR